MPWNPECTRARRVPPASGVSVQRTSDSPHEYASVRGGIAFDDFAVDDAVPFRLRFERN